jgi:hypothetical protein
MMQDFSNGGFTAPKWFPHAGGSMSMFKRTQVRAPAAVSERSAAAPWTIMWRCMLSKERGNMSMESRLQAVGARANTMMLKIQRARNGGPLTG